MYRDGVFAKRDDPVEEMNTVSVVDGKGSHRAKGQVRSGQSVRSYRVNHGCWCCLLGPGKIHDRLDQIPLAI